MYIGGIPKEVHPFIHIFHIVSHTTGMENIDIEIELIGYRSNSNNRTIEELQIANSNVTSYTLLSRGKLATN